MPIPEEYLQKTEEARAWAVEKLAEFNDEMMEHFMEDKEVTPELMKSALRDATLKLLITPVFCGAAYKIKVFICFSIRWWITFPLRLM